jgi:hypothetical protein
VNGEGSDWLFRAAVGVVLTVLGGLSVKGCQDRDEGLNRLTTLERDYAHMRADLDNQRELLVLAFDRVRALEIDRGKR